jgi:hypothetical protein
VKRARTGRASACRACLILLAGLGCTTRPAHIPERKITANVATRSGLGDGVLEAGLEPIKRLYMPPSRARVLAVVSLFQSSIKSGQPPLGELLSDAASLSVPGMDTRRGAPSRSAIQNALGANFADPTLSYDPFEVGIRSGDEGAIATVPLEPTSASSARQVVLSLHLGYAEGALRITDIALSRLP